MLFVGFCFPLARYPVFVCDVVLYVIGPCRVGVRGWDNMYIVSSYSRSIEAEEYVIMTLLGSASNNMPYALTKTRFLKLGRQKCKVLREIKHLRGRVQIHNNSHVAFITLRRTHCLALPLYANRFADPFGS